MKKFLPVLLLLFCNACVDVAVHTTLHRSGSGMQHWTFSSTALMAGRIKKQIESDPFFRRGRIVVDEFKDGDYRLELDIPFASCEELSQTGHEIAVDKAGLLRRTMTYRETWDPDLLRGSGILGQRLGGLIPIIVNIAVDMPGRIVGSNADAVDGSVARWNLSLGDLMAPRTLEVKSVFWNLWLVIPLALVFMASLAALVLLVAMATRRKPITGGPPAEGIGL